MLKHIVTWDLKEEFSLEKKKELALQIKNDLEALKGKVKEIVEIKVDIKEENNNVGIILDSSFNNEEDLDRYQKNPDHLKAAELIRSSTCNRQCNDYNV